MREDEANIKKTRRSNYAVDRDILEGVASLIKEVGFSKITLPAVAQVANVNISVIYRHFGSLEGLLDKYTQKFDYWLNSILDMDTSEATDEIAALNLIAEKLVKALSKDREMQQLMIWELTEDNPSTRRSANQRDAVVEKILPIYEKHLPDSDVNPKAILAIIVAGMYYIILRKDRSKFCSIDFSTKKGKEILSETMVKIVSYLKSVKEQKMQLMEIAKSLKLNNVEEHIILEATGISKEELAQL